MTIMNATMNVTMNMTVEEVIENVMRKRVNPSLTSFLKCIEEETEYSKE